MLSDPLFRQSFFEILGIGVLLTVLLLVGGWIERRRQRFAAAPPPASLREEIHNVMWGGQARWQLRAVAAIPGLVILALVLLAS